jgi:hypothetical protein
MKDHFETIRTSVSTYMRQKILFSKSDEVGVVLVGSTSCTAAAP